MSLHGYSPELRRDHDLPFVYDNDPKKELKLAELIIDFVSDILPAVGIVSSEDTTLSHEEVHASHQALIMRSIRRIKPKLLVDAPFKIGERFPSLHTRLHRDGYWPPVSRRGLTAKWKLHTAGKDSDADVLLANSSQGSVIGGGIQVGDAELYKGTMPFHELLCARGYETGIERVDPSTLYELLQKGSYEPILTAPDVYHFTQPALSSLLFKAVSAIGPSTVHGFQAIDGQRQVLTSDIVVVTRSSLEG